ncbi:hypothetical protein PG994_009502 [Apiospora phragmitis]|uniref:CMP/dCMP-type deaminase domain-containing protein n=1 Tax=Apiospora phragmitis TaxID=2905665 RepID=A0ABR1U6A0_9PEZI
MSNSTTHPRIAPGDHEAFMDYALSCARLSPPGPDKFSARDRPGDPGTTHAEHCCLIKIAEKYGVSEAELNYRLPRNTVLYTTMEPCNERLSRNRTCVERILALKVVVKTVYVGIKEPGTFIENNQGQERLEAAAVMIIRLESMEDRIMEVSMAGHEK